MRDRQNLVIALSLANFILMTQWIKVLVASPYAYFNASLPFCALVAILILLGAAAFVFYFILRTAERAKGSLRSSILYLLLMCFFLLAINKLRTKTNLAIVFPFFSASQSLSRLSVGEPALKIGIGIVSLCFALVLFFRFKRGAISVFRNVLVLLFPFLILTVGTTFGKAIRDYHPENNLSSSRLPEHRMVWLVFDEMDEYFAFRGRPPSVRLPEFDRIAKESLHATHAYPPSNRTLKSMAAYVTGRLVREAEPRDASELAVTFDGQSGAQPLSKQPNLFSMAKELGFKTGLAGWYHPYCRVFRKDLDECESEAILQSPYEDAVLPNLSVLLGDVLHYSNDPSSVHTAIYRRVLNKAIKLAADPTLGLVFIHLPVPHLPQVYQSPPLQFEAPDKIVESYFNNLILADATLGRIRRALESAGLENRTHFLITSDHWWREVPKKFLAAQLEPKEHHEVPFFIKVAGEKEEITYPLAFNALIGYDLVLAFLKEEISKNDEIVAWLTSRGLSASFQAAPVISSL
jgi:Sulfatase